MVLLILCGNLFLIFCILLAFLYKLHIDIVIQVVVNEDPIPTNSFMSLLITLSALSFP